MLHIILIFSIGSFGCSNREKEIWIYTSIYKEVIAQMKEPLQKAFPDYQINWYQGGSEVVGGKISAELAGGRTKANLVITSDPFWYEEMKRAGYFLAYDSPAAAEVPEHLSDPDHYYECSRLPVMVMGYNSEVISEAQAPKQWSDLSKPEWKNKISMGNPMESGTNFTWLAFLVQAQGWDFFKSLRSQELMAAGGNSSVIHRMDTQERPIGIVLLENILKSQSKGSPVRPIYPKDGVVIVPSPIAILKGSESKLETVQKIYDWFFSDLAQNEIVKSGMYSPLEKIPSPKGGLPWSEIKKNHMVWNAQVLQKIFSDKEEIKQKFSDVVLQ